MHSEEEVPDLPGVWRQLEAGHDWRRWIGFTICLLESSTIKTCFPSCAETHVNGWEVYNQLQLRSGRF
jgi:hypothetical protein